MHCVVIRADARQEKQFKATLDVVLSKFELRLDLIDFLVLQSCQLEGLRVKEKPLTMKAELANAAEKASLQNHLDVQAIFHALKVFSWVFYSH
jgi:hypothetical protein